MAKPDHFTGKLLVDKSYVEASGFPAFQLSTGKNMLKQPTITLTSDESTNLKDTD